MVVAAIVIPVLFFYFYKRTKNERQKHLEQLNHIGKINEESIIEGTVQLFSYHKERYYQEKYVFQLHITIQAEGKLLKGIVQKSTYEEIQKQHVTIGSTIRCYGSWSEQVFHINRYEVIHNTESSSLSIEKR